LSTIKDLFRFKFQLIAMEKTKHHFHLSERACVAALFVIVAIVVVIISYLEWKQKTGN